MEQWLKCKVLPGQFSNEYAVIGETFDGRDFALFAPTEFVQVDREPARSEQVAGCVRVIVEAAKDDLRLVCLPRQTLGNGSRVTVRLNQLRPIGTLQHV